MKPLVPLALAGLLAVSAGVALVGRGGHEDRSRPPEPAAVTTTTTAGAATTAHSDRSGPAEPADRRTPAHLRLWKFDASVIPVRLAGSELVPPADPSVLGWWGRPAGSTTGTTLLVGHTVHTGGGMLDDLEDTPVGDIAIVSGVRYRVATVKIITKAELAQHAQQLFAQTGPPKLTIVTCEGYDQSTGHYADNVVLIARPL